MARSAEGVLLMMVDLYNRDIEHIHKDLDRRIRFQHTNKAKELISFDEQWLDQLIDQRNKAYRSVFGYDYPVSQD